MGELSSKIFLSPTPYRSLYQQTVLPRSLFARTSLQVTRRSPSKARGVSFWGPNAHPGSSHSGHLTPLQPSQSPRAPPTPCKAPYRRGLGPWTLWASQGMQEGHCRPRGCATLPGDRPPPRLTPCRWKPSPPAGCSLLAPSPMASLSLCCVAWSREARPRPPGCHSS